MGSHLKWVEVKIYKVRRNTIKRLGERPPKGKGLTEQNKSRSLYGRRLKGRSVPRNYILWEASCEIAHAVHRKDEKKAVEAYSRLLNRVEELNNIVI